MPQQSGLNRTEIVLVWRARQLDRLVCAESGKLRACLFPTVHLMRESLFMLLKALRVGLGQLIIFLSFITRPSKMKRDAEAQAKVDQAAAQLSLYQFNACPFCVKTRRTLRRLNLPIALHDAKHNPEARQALLEQGGKIQVPCLRIDEGEQTTWLYESKAINSYLEQRFAA